MTEAGNQIFQFLAQYGYWIMLPLMIIEGPVVTIIASMLAKLGAFNIWIVLALSVLGDMLGDMFWYALGYRFGFSFVDKLGKYFGITRKLVNRMEQYFMQHGGKTIFSVKSTTGLCWATFVAAGIAKMNFRKFVEYSFLGGLVWSGFLVSIGYFYGYLWKTIQTYISWIGWLIFFLALFSFMGINLYKKREGEKMLENNEDKNSDNL